jgi:hypothetical protein
MRCHSKPLSILLTQTKFEYIELWHEFAKRTMIGFIGKDVTQ